MIHAVTLMLDTDTIDYMDWCAKRLAEQRGKEVTRSDVVKLWREMHLMKQVKRYASTRHNLRAQRMDKKAGRV